MFKDHPKIAVSPSAKDRHILKLAWGLVLLNILTVLAFYFELPQTIPTHFNFMGAPDAFGDKTNIWMLPILNILTTALLYFVTIKVKPHNYNYPTKVTPKNAPKLYAMSLQMLSWLSVAIAFLFLTTSVHSLLIAKGINYPFLGWLSLGTGILITIGPLLWIPIMIKIPK